MPLPVGGDDAVHFVIGDHVGIDDKAVGICQFLSGTEFCFQREGRIVDQQVHDSLDTSIQVQGYIIDVLSCNDVVTTHGCPPSPRFPGTVLLSPNLYRHS